MDVKPGYKQTDLGVIPEDWDVRKLGDVGESLIGLTYKPTDVRSDGTLVLRASNIQEGSLCFDDNVFVDLDVPDRIMVRDGDILICVRNGSRALIGKCARLDERAQGMTFGAFMAVFRTPAGRFVHHQFQSALLKRQIHEHLGATINQITNKSLNSFAIPLPPTKAEQSAIAEALGDADALIESLERLLVKKREIKQGAMQELLTGKRRLSVFNGDWELKRLGELAEIRGGGTPSTSQSEFWDGDISWCTPTDITALDGFKYLDSTSRTISEQGLRNSSAERIPAGSITMTSRATIGECAINRVSVATNQGFKNFMPNDTVDTEFLYYLLLTQKQSFMSLSSGSSVGGRQSMSVQVAHAACERLRSGDQSGAWRSALRRCSPVPRGARSSAPRCRRGHARCRARSHRARAGARRTRARRSA